MSPRVNRWVIAAAIAALVLGAILSRVIEPGVRVQKVMLTSCHPNNERTHISLDVIRERTHL